MITMISGRAGEGKSTFAKFCTNLLIEEFNEGSAIVPFARMVKETAMFMGWDKEKDDKGRKLLQDIGNIGRDYNENLWANQTVEYVKELSSTFSYIFIDDWRFPNEGNVVIDSYVPVTTVKICRPPEFHTLFGTELYDDVSETSLPDDSTYYDFVMDNAGTLEELEEKARIYIKTVLMRGK